MPFASSTAKSKSVPVNNANVQRQTLRGFGDPAIDPAQETDVRSQLDHAVQFGHGVDQPIQRQAESGLEEEEETVQRQAEAGLEEEEELPVQAKLTIGQPGDKYEQEADQMAAKVMRMPEPSGGAGEQGSRGAGESFIQRSAETQEEEEIQTKPLVQREAMPGDEEEETLQARLQAKGGSPAVPGGFEGQLASHRGGGQPLSDQTRAFMEPRFGTDFGGVRVHETPDLANAIQAQAFTHGQDIYFNSGKYSPGSSGGKELLAHELTHVVQQSSSNIANIQKYDSFEHAQLGDNAAGSQRLNIQGVEITEGEINALGDFYTSPDDLMQADSRELRRLVRLLRKQRADPDSVSEADWENATNGRYTDLATNNSGHFAPQNPELLSPQASTPSEGSDHRSIWTEYHRRSLSLAQEAALEEDESRKQTLILQARTTNAFADHYLSDAFSAGHLFNKDDAMKIIQENISSLTDEHEKRLFESVAKKVFETHGDLISQYEVKYMGVFWPDLNSSDRFQSLLEGIYEERPKIVYNAVVKAAHDGLNSRIGGVPVKNDYATWNLSGDDSLASSPETQFWAQHSIETARKNVERALEPVCITDEEINQMVKLVLSYFPHPTNASTEMIHDMLEEVTDSQGTMGAAISDILSSQISVVLEKLIKEGYVRPIDRSVSPAR